MQAARESSVFADLYSGILAAEILYKKGLRRQCLRQVEKVCKKALQHQHFMILDQLLEWRIKVLLHEHELEGIIRLITEQQHLLDKRKRELDMRETAFHIYKFVSENEQKKSTAAQFRPLIAKLRKRTLSNSDSTLTAYYYHSAWMLYHRYCGNKEARLLHAQQALKSIEQNRLFLDASPRLYLSAVNNLCNALLNLSFLKQTEEQLRRLRKRVIDSGKMMQREVHCAALSTILNAEMLLMVNHHRFSKIENLQREIDTLLNTEGHALEEVALADLCFNTAHALFLSGRYDRVNDYLYFILSRKKNPTLADIYICARMLSLMAHHETGYHQLGSLVTAMLKYLHRQNMLGSFDKLFLDYLKQNNSQRKQELLAHLLDQLRQPDKTDSYFLKIIDISYWLRGKRSANHG